MMTDSPSARITHRPGWWEGREKGSIGKGSTAPTVPLLLLHPSDEFFPWPRIDILDPD